ncbi:hypothetical protein [Mangrovitalea sediminis]|uniref:hypothetical protein n=1 Tax=Mangrovitalea sediminis TaxID=1982043 RepID=UPI000BE5DF2C|nr:hypothetical protein [Mangrovitalea sediminis]
MNKWLLRLLFILAVALLAYMPALFQKKKNESTATPLPSFESVVPPPIRDGGPHVVYKWQENGVWHYADKPPANHDWEPLTVNPDTNLIPSPKDAGKNPGTPAPMSDTSSDGRTPGGRVEERHALLSGTRPPGSSIEFD